MLVLTPYDVVEPRGERSDSPRDNVLFELGLFMGRLGRFRTFIVADRTTRLKLPSDLAGFTTADLVERPDNPRAAVSPACTQITAAMRKLGRLVNDAAV